MKKDDGTIAVAIFKTTGDSQWLDVESNYDDLLKVSYQVTVKYPYPINNPQTFVSKCFGDNFSTCGDPGDEVITISCNSWVWVVDYNCAMSDYLCYIPDEDKPDIWDHVTIIDETIDYAY